MKLVDRLKVYDELLDDYGWQDLLVIMQESYSNDRLDFYLVRYVSDLRLWEVDVVDTGVRVPTRSVGRTFENRGGSA